jgi:hypothetical protein
MRLRPIAFVRAHHCAAATHFGGRYARVEATSMAEADLQSTPEARLSLVARGWAIGVNAESAK